MESDPANTGAWYHRGLTEARLEEAPGCHRIFRPWSSPWTRGTGHPTTGRGWPFLPSESTEEAVRSFSRAIEPRPPEYRMPGIRKGMALAGTGRYGEAISAFDRGHSRPTRPVTLHGSRRGPPSPTWGSTRRRWRPLTRLSGWNPSSVPVHIALGKALDEPRAPR